VWHNKRLFKQEYAPLPFSHAIRRPGHYPEGVLSIEETTTDATNGGNEPMFTVCSRRTSTHAMHFALNASTNIRFFGDRVLHGRISYQFKGESGTSLLLRARARQFSSFILLVGRIGGADVFEPEHAMLIRDKDDLAIPLWLETIPTPAEFKKAVESLSPEQRAFATAYRGMQLSSTLFGLLVIQVKPMLESVLKLPADSLTKEIKLTQQLMQL